MSTAALRIFSYLPNPRVWKALIAAEYCGVHVEVIGDKPRNLAGWLWDYDARLLDDSERNEENPNARVGQRGFSGTLYKTDAFLDAHPFGTVPAAFSPGGDTGIFESNSILRAVVRAATEEHTLYGADDYEASRIDSFLDAGLVFAREAQVYLLGIENQTAESHERMAAAYHFYVAGIDNALAGSTHIATQAMSMADIGFVCDLGQFLRERLMNRSSSETGSAAISADLEATYPNAFAHLRSLAALPAFSKHLGDYVERSLDVK